MKKECIVLGSGLGGTIVSNALSSEFDVTVLEIGPRNTITYPEVSYSKKRLSGINTFCYGAGGTTNLWHNGLIPLRTSDVRSPAFKHVLEECRQYINQAASLLHFDLPSYQDEFERLLSEVEELGNSITNFDMGIDCLVYPNFHKPLVLSNNVSAYYDVNGVEFECADEHVTTVRFETGGRNLALEADYVIISAGALGSPIVLDQILRAAESQSHCHGDGFIDHPMGFIGKFRFPKNIANSVAKFALLKKPHYRSRNVIRLRSDCGEFTACAFFRPVATLSNNLSIYKYKSLLGASKGLERLKNILSFRIFHPDILMEIVSHLFDIQIPTTTYSVLFIGEQRRGRNRVRLENGKLTIDWELSDEELRAYSSMIRKLTKLLDGIAERSQVQTDFDQNWFWSSAHHSGTIALGDEREHLLDRNLRVKSMRNVFVCDGSVIPEHSYANSGLTIAQLALRLAARLREVNSAT